MADKIYKSEEINVLVVDEYAQNRAQIRRVLDRLEFGQVSDASRIEDALKALKDDHFDLVICDIYMGHGQGRKVVQYIRERNAGSDIPVIVLTGEASEEAVVNASDLGANEYLLKPFHPEDLSEKIEKVLNQYFSPNQFDQLVHAGEKAYLQKRFHEAITHFDNALAINNDSAKVHYQKALALIGLGEDEAAKRILQANRVRNKDYYRNQRSLADLALKEENQDEAIDLLKEELVLHPKQPARQTKLGVLYLKKSFIEPAIECFRVALLENQKYRDALIGMAHAYLKLENLDKALYYFKRTRKHHLSDIGPLKLAVKHCLLNNVPRKAELMLREEHAARPKDVAVLELLAKFFSDQKRSNDALIYVEKILNLQDGNPEALGIKVNIYLSDKKYKEAIPILVTLIESRKNLADYDALGLSYIKTGALSEAVGVLERAMLGTPLSPSIVDKLAYCYFLSKEFVKCYHLLQHVKDEKSLLFMDKDLQGQAAQGVQLRRRFRSQKVS